ncbi:MAG: helix-turn-helix transcriptional regulator [Lachnospiraceae bacterium]|nr:helix-turn-helix transcriptional regulator [Lachnospiraceae bacterium]
MKTFSDLLKNYIQQKKIVVSAMSQHLQIDRANLYKIINGKRTPSSHETAVKISEYLALTPSERAEFMEAYRIALIGIDVYYQRKSALHFLLNSFSAPPFDYIPEISSHASSPVTMDLPSGIIPLFGTSQIHQMLSLMCNQAIAKPSASIKILAQPDWNYLMSLLQSLSHLNSGLSITQIICLNTGEEPSGKGEILYNISMFEKIMPLFGCSCQYEPRFFYDNVDSHYKNIQLFSYMVITDEYILTCSSDITQGILCHQQDIHQLYSSFYEKQLLQTTLLFHKIRLDAVHYMQLVQQTLELSLESIPCLLLCISPELLDKVLLVPAEISSILSESTDNDSLRTQILKHIQMADNIPVRIRTFSDSGLRFFMNTGRVLSYPDELYQTIHPEDRLPLLKSFRNYCCQSNVRLLKGDLAQIPLSMFVYTTKQKGTVFFRDSDNQLVYLSLQEKTLLQSLNELLFHLEDANFVCTQEETNSYLDTMIRKYS